MKKFSFLTIIMLFVTATASFAQVQKAQTLQVGQTSTNTPNASAALQIDDTTRGLLIPRMTTTQRTAIATPAAGLQVYDTTTNTNWFYNGTIWINNIAGGQKWIDGSTQGDIEFVNPTGTDNIKYSDSKFTSIDKNYSDPFNYYDYLTASVVPKPAIATYESKYFKLSKFTNLTYDVVNIGPASVEANVGIVDATNTINNRPFNVNSNLLIVDQANTNSTTNLRSIVGETNYSSSAYVNNLGAGSFGNFFGVTGSAGTINGLEGTNNVGTSGAIVDVQSVRLANAIRSSQTGAITNIVGVKSDNIVVGGSSAITNLIGMQYAPDVRSGYTGTITNSYDLFLKNITTPSKVTNAYGLVVQGTTKLSQFQGRVSIAQGVAAGSEATIPRVADLYISRGDITNGTAAASVMLSRTWTSTTNARASAMYHLYDTTDTNEKLIIGVSGSKNPLDLDQARMTVTSTGRVGIGTTIPSGVLHTTGSANVLFDRIGSTSTLFLRSANGAVGALTPSTSGSVISSMTFAGYNGTSLNTDGAVINAIASENFTSTAGGTSLSFRTTASGTTASTARMLISSNGNVGIGTTTPVVSLDVNGAIKIGTTAATPVAGMIRFDGTNFQGYNGTAWVQLNN